MELALYFYSAMYNNILEWMKSIVVF
jgi:hypothetical protein